MRTTSLALLGASLSALLFATACRGGDDSGDDDGNNDSPGVDARTDGTPSDGHVVAGEVTVKEVQNDAMASGTEIELKGVVVTAIDTFGAKTGDLWVEDVGGGAFSGVKVFGASLTDVATLAVGDTVNISGAQKYEFACTGTICGTGVFDPGQSITEVEGVSAGSLVITKTGAGTPITPDLVDANAIAAMPAAAQLTEWEKWEGVLIKVTNVVQVGNKVGFSGMDSEVDQFKFEIAGGIAVETVMTDFPATSVADYCYSSLTGVGDYFFDYLLLPRSAADIGAAGTSCTGQAAATTVSAIQAGTATGAVKLDGVYVTAIAFNKKNYWVSDSLTAAPGTGVYVFGTATLPTEVVVGAKVKVIGSAVEFNDSTAGDTLTEISGASTTFVSAPTAAPTPVTGQTAAAVSVKAYEGTLVTLTNVKVKTLGTMTNSFLTTLTQAGADFTADDDIYRFVAADDQACYASITGIAHFNVYENKFVFDPISAGTTGGTCN